MNFSDKLLRTNQEKANKTLVIVGVFVSFLLLSIGILDFTGVFVIKHPLFNTAIILSVIISLMPLLIFKVFKKTGIFAKYVVLTCYIIMSGFMYSIVSYHAIIMLIFPLACSCLYSEQKYVIYTLIMLIPTVIISHLVAYNLKIVPDEPLVTLHGVLVYGILPRLIQILAIGAICIGITGRLHKTIETLKNKNDELYQGQQLLIESLSELLESQSQETGQHVKRVSEYTRILCKGLGFDDETTWKVSLASMMHDVGKIMIPSSIIEKPSKLTKEEFEIIKKHTDLGKKMLEKSPAEMMQLSSSICYLHHEKYDGTGYHNITGEDIDINSRIVAVADVFDALVSKRPYKKSWSKVDAYNEIVNGSGTHFDPKVVEVFINHFSEFEEVMEKYPDDGNIDINDRL